MNDHQNGLSDFTEFLREFRRLSTWACVTGAAAVPFVAAFYGIIPSWPKHIALITAVFELLVVMLVYQLSFRSARQIVSKTMILSLALFVILISGYLFGFSMFTIYVPGSNEYTIVGYECTKRALEAYPDSCPYLGLHELASARYDQFELWTRLSVSIVRTAITVMWFGLFILLSAFVALFISYQRRTRLRATR